MSVIELASCVPAEAGHVDIAHFKQAMRHLAGAVSVVTVGHGEQRTGFTASSVSSFSIEPPTMLVSLNRESSSWPALLKARAFTINVLASRQTSVADRFAGKGGAKGADRYAGADWRPGSTGTLGLSGAVAVIDCDLDEAIERHSHAILLGRVRTIAYAIDDDPLLYFKGSYRHLGSPIDR